MYNHYYNKTNSIKIIGFKIEDNQPCILIKNYTQFDNVIIKFHAYENDKLDGICLQQAGKCSIIMHF